MTEPEIVGGLAALVCAVLAAPFVWWSFFLWAFPTPHGTAKSKRMALYAGSVVLVTTAATIVAWLLSDGGS
jgi:hypothetical protein